MVSWAETFTDHSLTSICSDQGGEFMAGELQLFFRSRGISHQTSVPHTPQQNGCAERFNWTLLEKPYANMHICHDLSGKMLLKLHYISTTNNPCVIMIGRHPLNNSMETNLMFHILEFLEHVLMSGYHQNNNKISSLPNLRRWSLLDRYEPNTKGYRFGQRREDK